MSLKWMQDHKHLIMVLIVCLAILVIVFKVVSHLDGIAHDRRVIAEQQVKADLEKAKLQADQSKADTLKLNGQLDELAASNKELQTQIAQMRSQLAAQKSKDAAMPPDELAARWHFLVPQGNIKSVPDGLQADIVASHATVSALEEIPDLKAENQEYITNSGLKDETINQAVKTIGDKDKELDTCKQTVVDEKKACSDTISDLKHKAAKRSFWATVGGFVGGVIFGRKL